MHPVVGWSTRVANHSCTMIDYIFLANASWVDVCVIDNEISDHRSVFCEFDGVNRGGSSYTHRRPFNREAIAKFSLAPASESWESVYWWGHINETFNCFFFDIFLHNFNTYFPVRKYFDNNRSEKSWMNDEVRISRANLRDLGIVKNTYP